MCGSDQREVLAWTKFLSQVVVKKDYLLFQPIFIREYSKMIPFQPILNW